MSRAAAAGLAERAAALAAERAGRLSDRVVGFFGRYLPPELPAALGLDPALLAFGTGALARLAGGAFARADSCPFCRAALGAPAAQAPWAGRLALVAAGTACDQQRRMLESFARYHGVPVRAFGVPRTLGENARRRYRGQLDGLLRALSERFGVRLEAGGLGGAVALYGRLRRRLRALRARLPFAEFAGLVEDCFFLGAERSLALLDEVALPERPAPRMRLMLAGSCLGRSDARLLDEVLGPAGAEVVDDAAAAPAGLLEVEPPDGAADLAALADAYFDQPEVGRRPNDGWHGHLRRKAADARADAVIFRFVKFCDLNAAERLRVREALAPVPVLFLEEEGGSGPAARRSTRLEALLETAACRRA